MQKYTPVQQQVAYAVNPITINESGLHATVTFGTVTEVDNPDGSGTKLNQFNQIAQSNHWLPQEEAQSVLQTMTSKDEAVGDALERAVAAALRAKGEMKF